jgi:hypothetical protein
MYNFAIFGMFAGRMFETPGLDQFFSTGWSRHTFLSREIEYELSKPLFLYYSSDIYMGRQIVCCVKSYQTLRTTVQDNISLNCKRKKSDCPKKNISRKHLNKMKRYE